MPDPINIGNRDYLTRVLLAEAGGEGPHGLLAVAATIVNRAKQTGLSLSQIVQQRGQFEPTFTSDGQARMARQNPASSIWQTASSAIDRALAGEDPTGGADHFFSPRAQAAAGRERPTWARSGARPIGNHEFFKLGWGNRRIGSESPATVPHPSPAPMAAPQAPRPLWRPGEALAGGRGGVARLPETTPPVRPARVSEAAAFATAVQGVAGPTPNVDATTQAPRLEAGAASQAYATEQQRLEDISLGEKVGLSISRTLTGELTRTVMNAMEGNQSNWDANFNYEKQVYDTGGEQGRTIREVDEMRTARSLQEWTTIVAEQDARKEERKDMGGGALPVVLDLVTNLVDPSGLALGLGVGKGIQMMGVGSRVLAMQGSRIALTASLAAEGAAGNVLGTAALDAMGTYTTPNDYLASAAFGAGLGLVAVPFVSRGAEGARVELRGIQEQLDDITNRAAQDEIGVALRAQEALGPTATPEQMAAKIEELHNQDGYAIYDNMANPAKQENLLLRADAVIDEADPVRAAALEDARFIPEAADQEIVAQYRINAAAIAARNPVEAANDIAEQAWLGTGQASAYLNMIRSQSPVLRGIAQIATEGGAGHGGRRWTMAIDKTMQETSLNRVLLGWDSNFDVYRRGKGVNRVEATLGDQSLQRGFNEQVSLELRDRARPDLYVASSDPSVVRAADMISDLYRQAGELQVKWQTLGWENIKPGDPSYFPQHIDAGKLVALRSGKVEGVDLVDYEKIIAEQVRTIYGWDAAFSDKFGKRYIKTGLDRASGGFNLPANLTHHQAGDIISDVLSAMRQGADKGTQVMIDKASAAFARGGAGYTKGRINFDVSNDYLTASGKRIRLLDIMESDQLAIARRYVARAAGEVASHKYGVSGKHGWDLLREAVVIDHQKGTVTNRELDAFDQIAAEMLNQPFGKAKTSRIMQNANLITSVLRLGGAGINAVGELSGGISSVGIARTLKGVAAVPRMLKEVSAIRNGKEADNHWLGSLEGVRGFEFGLDDYVMNRPLDIRDQDIQTYNADNLGIVSRAARSGAHLQAVLSANRIVTAISTRMFSEQIVQKAIRFIREGREDAALTDMGFSPELKARIKENATRMDVVKNGKVIGVDITAGDLTPAEMDEFTSVITRGSSQIIQRTYIGETGMWAHNDYLKTLLQFRTYSMVAVEKQWGRNVRTQGHIGALATLVMATAFVTPIYTARVMFASLGKGEEERKAYLDKMLSPVAIVKATQNYVSNSGFLGDFLDVGGSSVAGLMGDNAPEWLTQSIGPRGAAVNKQLLGGVIMPSAGVAQDAFQLARGDWKKLRTLTPFNSLPALLPAENALEDALTEDKK